MGLTGWQFDVSEEGATGGGFEVGALRGAVVDRRDRRAPSRRVCRLRQSTVGIAAFALWCAWILCVSNTMWRDRRVDVTVAA